jgi:hypothetical protein
VGDAIVKRRNFGRLAVIAASTLLVASPLCAQEHSTYESLWNGVVKDPDCKPADYPDFILVTCQGEFTLWYFTKPNHAAHPGVIKRTISRDENGAVSAREEGTSFASDAAQPAFKAWLAQIADLDRQAREYIEKQNRAVGGVDPVK